MREWLGSCSGSEGEEPWVEIEAATTAAFWCASPHLLRHNPMLPAASSNGKLPMNPVLSITQFLKPKKIGLHLTFTSRLWSSEIAPEQAALWRSWTDGWATLMGSCHHTHEKYCEYLQRNEAFYAQFQTRNKLLPQQDF